MSLRTPCEQRVRISHQKLARHIKVLEKELQEIDNDSTLGCALARPGATRRVADNFREWAHVGRTFLPRRRTQARSTDGRLRVSPDLLLHTPVRRWKGKSKIAGGRAALRAGLYMAPFCKPVPPHLKVFYRACSATASRRWSLIRVARKVPHHPQRHAQGSKTVATRLTNNQSAGLSAQRRASKDHHRRKRLPSRRRQEARSQSLTEKWVSDLSGCYPSGFAKIRRRFACLD